MGLIHVRKKRAIKKKRCELHNQRNHVSGINYNKRLLKCYYTICGMHSNKSFSSAIKQCMWRAFQNVMEPIAAISMCTSHTVTPWIPCTGTSHSLNHQHLSSVHKSNGLDWTVRDVRSQTLSLSLSAGNKSHQHQVSDCEQIALAWPSVLTSRLTLGQTHLHASVTVQTRSRPDSPAVLQA